MVAGRHAGRRAPVDREVDGGHEVGLLHVRERGGDPGVGERGEQHRGRPGAAGRCASSAPLCGAVERAHLVVGEERERPSRVEAGDPGRRRHVRALEHVPRRLALAPGAAGAERRRRPSCRPGARGSRRERRRAAGALDRRADLELARLRRRQVVQRQRARRTAPARRAPPARAWRARPRGPPFGPRWTNQCSLAPAARQRPSAPSSAVSDVEPVRHARRRSPTARSAGAAGAAAAAPTSSSRPSSRISDGTSSARTIVASISTASAVPTPELLDEDDLRGRERADRDHEQQRGEGDDAAGALEPERDRLLVAARRCRAPP